MIGFPERHEASPYYFSYIDRVASGDVAGSLATQLAEATELWSSIGEEKSLHRYAPGKWSIRQLLNHVNDAKRVFVSRALWFGRGFDSALPSFDQDVAAAAAPGYIVSPKTTSAIGKGMSTHCP